MEKIQVELSIRACTWYDAEDLSCRKLDPPAWKSLRDSVVGATWYVVSGAIWGSTWDATSEAAEEEAK